MLKSELLKIEECCFNCKYGRSICKNVGVIPVEYREGGRWNFVFHSKDELKRSYPLIDDAVVLRDIDVAISNCHKLPPRLNGSRGIFPEVAPDSWCGSYKQKDAEVAK